MDTALSSRVLRVKDEGPGEAEETPHPTPIESGSPLRPVQHDAFIPMTSCRNQVDCALMR